MRAEGSVCVCVGRASRRPPPALHTPRAPLRRHGDDDDLAHLLAGLLLRQRAAVTRPHPAGLHRAPSCLVWRAPLKAAAPPAPPPGGASLMAADCLQPREPAMWRAGRVFWRAWSAKKALVCVQDRGFGGYSSVEQRRRYR